MIEPLDMLLTGWTAPGVWATASLPQGVTDRAHGLGWTTIVPEGPLASKESFLAALRNAAGFPEWVGHNWDAFEDAITDLSWLSADRVLVLLEGPLPDTAIDVLIDAARFWDRHRRRFAVVVTGPLDGRAALLPRLDHLPVVGQRPPIRLTGQ